MTEQDIKERIARIEQNHSNLKENFTDFKDEVSRKLELLLHDVEGIKITIAKYLGGFTVVIFILELVVKKFL